MNTHSRTTVVLACLVGGLLTHVAMTACAPSSGSATSGAVAHAQSADTCKKWEVQGFLPTGFTFQNVNSTNADGSPEPYALPTFAPFALPAGWEPFAGGDLGAVIARKCTSQ